MSCSGIDWIQDHNSLCPTALAFGPSGNEGLGLDDEATAPSPKRRKVVYTHSVIASISSVFRVFYIKIQCDDFYLLDKE
jgi:hypothetical protein